MKPKDKGIPNRHLKNAAALFATFALVAGTTHRVQADGLLTNYNLKRNINHIVLKAVPWAKRVES